jgi:hypothetical protein
MHLFELGEGAFLKPEYLPVTIVRRFGDTYEIQHSVEPGTLVTNDSGTFYEGLAVEIVGDTETSVLIAYTARVDQLISKQDFNNLCEHADLRMNPDDEDTDETEDTEE